jgi:hypothetical protein
MSLTTYSLLDDLDEDLFVELDEVIRSNQQETMRQRQSYSPDDAAEIDTNYQTLQKTT